MTKDQLYEKIEKGMPHDCVWLSEQEIINIDYKHDQLGMTYSEIWEDLLIEDETMYEETDEYWEAWQAEQNKKTALD